MDSKLRSFRKTFEVLTGHAPFPWQERLYDRFVGGLIPAVAELPTGLGKTNVIAVWLLALLKNPDCLPRRLVYVVNRRTVVDQTTAEVERVRANLPQLGTEKYETLAISTLRGQFADNAEWSADPSTPAVICGTVDMIGSRLLFEGYRIGFRSRPLHAGFLGQDALLVHDEAHLEPAFQRLLETIQDEQRKERERNGEIPWPPLRVMALSATARQDRKAVATGDRELFELTDEEKQAPPKVPDPPTEPIHHVWRRLSAKKLLRLEQIETESKLAEKIVELATRHDGSKTAVLVFVREVKDVSRVFSQLTDSTKGGIPEERVRTLTGTMRGYERDQLVDHWILKCFLREACPLQTVYLVCTSAGEVGVNLSADQMVCDLSTFDSMAQRLGRINRFGDRDDAQVDVVCPNLDTLEEKHPLTPRRKLTFALLRKLNGDASPRALSEIPSSERLAAFAPEPTMLPATDILFDAWALTTIQGNMPGRPPIAPYLHGVAEWEPPRTSVAWRSEVEFVTEELFERGRLLPQELLADYPLKPHELLNDQASRIHAALLALIAEPKKSIKGEKRAFALKRAHMNAKAPLWLIDASGSVAVTALGKLLDEDKKRVIGKLGDGIVLLPPSVGGLSGGMLDPQAPHADDVADYWLDEENQPRRQRHLSDNAQPLDGPEAMTLIRTIDTDPLADEVAVADGEIEINVKADSESSVGHPARPRHGRFWHWYARPRNAEDATRASARPIEWNHHTRDVVRRATDIVKALNLAHEHRQAVILAAELHDLGKQREIWQRSIGNPSPTDWHAKPGKPVHGPRWSPRYLSDYRHEFGSLLDSLHGGGDGPRKLSELNHEMRDVVLHLIAAHHGYARPHFPPTAYDHERYNLQQNQHVALEAMRRYARLQWRYGRWGLAYLESLLRAADWAASANPSDNAAEVGGRA